MTTLGAVIVAAGKGRRMGDGMPKQYRLIGGKPILVHTLEAFERADLVDEVALVAPPEDLGYCKELREHYQLRKLQHIVAGGGERQHSVYAGLRQLNAEWAIVHDGVRPFVNEALMARCYAAAREHGGAVAALPVKETIKIVDGSGRVSATPDRSTLWTVQTPQVFLRQQLIAAHEAADQDGYIGTDDAALAERVGIPVFIVTGDYENIKITTPDDMAWAEYYLARTGGDSR